MSTARLPWENGAGKAHFGTAHGIDTTGGGAQRTSKYWSMNDAGPARTKNMIDQWIPYFGLPNPNTKHMVAQQEEQEVESHDYPEAFNMYYGAHGQWTKNGHLEKVLIEKVKATRNWQLTHVAPVKHHDASLDFTWNITMFNQHLLDHLPERALPRLSSHKSTSGRATMARYGMAITAEATFATTPAGRYMWAMQLEQMRIATVNSMRMGVMAALVTAPPHEDVFAHYQSHLQQSSGTFDLTAINNIFNEELHWFAIVHKSAAGYAQVTNKLAETIQGRDENNGTRGNFQIVPNGMQSFIMESKLGNHVYYMDGPGSDGEIMGWSGAQAAVVASCQFPQGQGMPMYDPVFSKTAIGDFMVACDKHLHDVKPENYLTSMQDIWVYSLDLDAEVRLSYSDHHMHAGVWDYGLLNAPLTDLIGQSFVNDSEVYTYGQLIRKAMDDDGMRRVVQSLLRLNRTKQTEFINSIELINKNNTDLICPGERWPSNFKIESLKNLREKNYVDVPKQITVSQHMRVAQYDENAQYSGLSLISDMSDDVVQRSRQVAGSKRARENEYISLEEMHKTGMNVDEDEKELEPAHYEQMPDGSTRYVQAQLTGQVEQRRPRAVFHSNRTAAVNPGAQSDAGKIDALSKEIRASVMYALVKGDTDVVGTVISSGFTEPQQVLILNQIKTILDGLDDGAGKKQENQALFRVHLSRFVSRFEVEASVRSEDRYNLTQLEKEFVNAGYDTSATFTPDALKTGLWKLNGNDDGQVELSLLLLPPTEEHSTILLPSDAFAASLTARHSVLFAPPVTTTTANLLASAEALANSASGMKKSRMDAFVWSIVMTAAQRAFSEEVADQNKKYEAIINATKTAMGSALLPRLQTMAALLNKDDRKALPLRVLPSQMFLKDIIVTVQTFMIATIMNAGANANGKLVKDNVLLVADRALGTDEPKLLQQHYTRAAVNPVFVSTKPAKNAGGAAVVAIADSYKTQPAQPTGGFSQWSEQVIMDLLNRASICSGVLFRFLVVNNVPVPLAIEYDRPNKIFETAEIIRLEAGENGAARTFYQKPHFAVATNVGEKVIWGNFSVYFKTVVFNPALVAIQKHVYIKRNGYHGGFGTDVNDPNNGDDTNAWANAGSKVKSLFVKHIFQNKAETRDRFWRCFGGQLPTSLPHTRQVAEMVDFEGSQGFRDLWAINNNTVRYGPPKPGQVDRNDPYLLRHNVMLFQGFQRNYIPETNGFTDVVQNRGHFGLDSCYAGAGEVYRGIKMQFQVPTTSATNRMQLVRGG